MMIPLTHSTINGDACTVVAVVSFLICIISGIVLTNASITSKTGIVSAVTSCVTVFLFLAGLTGMLSGLVVMEAHGVDENAPTQNESFFTTAYVTQAQARDWIETQGYSYQEESSSGEPLYKTKDGKTHVNCTLSYRPDLVQKGTTYYAQPILSAC